MAWEEAFAQGIRMASNEAREEARDIAKYGAEAGTAFFGPWADSLERAYSIYAEEMAAVRRVALERAAKRVLLELPDGVAKEELAEALRADDCSYLVEW